MNNIAMPSPSGTNFAGMTLPSGKGFDRCGQLAGHERSPQYAYDSAKPPSLPFGDNDEAHAKRLQKLLAFLSCRLTTPDFLEIAKMLTAQFPSTKLQDALGKMHAEDSAASCNTPSAELHARFPEARRIRQA